MDREYLLKLRNELIYTELGEIMFKYLHDYATKNIGVRIHKDDIAGFLNCIQVLKDIPSEVDKSKRSIQ